MTNYTGFSRLPEDLNYERENKRKREAAIAEARGFIGKVADFEPTDSYIPAPRGERPALGRVDTRGKIERRYGNLGFRSGR
jgi:hypothetical protein